MALRRPDPGPDVDCVPCSRGYHEQCLAGCADQRGDVCACYPVDPSTCGICTGDQDAEATMTGRAALEALERRGEPWAPQSAA